METKRSETNGIEGRTERNETREREETRRGKRGDGWGNEMRGNERKGTRTRMDESTERMAYTQVSSPPCVRRSPFDV